MTEFVPWVPLHQHSNLSLLDGFSVPKDIAKTCASYGYRAAAITDHRNVAAHVKFFKACKDAGIKPILGCEFDISDDLSTVRTAANRSTNHLVVLCKNLAGWYEMLRAVSKTNDPNSFYYKARISLEECKEFLSSGNHVAISGHAGSTICDILFTSTSVYRSKSEEQARTFLREDWETVLEQHIQKHIDVFGKENFFLEIQLIDKEHLPMTSVTAECLRCMSQKLNIKTVATADSHYVRKSDAIYQRILLCSNLGRTLPGVIRDIQNGKDVPLGTFFVSDNYHIPTYAEMQALHTQEELENAVLIADMCEEYDILSTPQLPKFDCPNGISEIEYVKQLCREGWKKLPFKKQKDQVYINRVKEELQVIEEANLAGYFLIVWDIIRFCKSKNWKTGVGRGSAAGCLMSYLIGITGIDPIPYNLLFSRFYNSGRKGTLPDIDLDIPSQHRDEIIQYIKTKYGEDKVSQMATFSSLMGKSAMKEVLRIEDVVTPAEANEITEHIPDKAEIADELENMEDASIIKWALIHRASKLSQWCTIDEDDNLSGPLAGSFYRAIQIEGCYKSQGKHPAGVIISYRPLQEICPIVRDKDGAPIAGLEMGDLEALGHVKFDILGVSILDKLMDIIPHLPEGCNVENLEDKATWKTFADGDVKGIFQLEKQKRWVKKLKPENIHHLAALVSIIRPGCVESLGEDGVSMTQHYIDRKNGEEEVPSIHEVVDKTLKDTYGVLVYQETAMLLSRDVAGFTLDEADELRKAIGKKRTDVMAKVKDKFFKGSSRVSVTSEEITKKIFDWIEKSQRYSFNASHAYSYGHNAYYSAYCKTHNPIKFYEVYLNHSKNGPDRMEEIKDLVNDARQHGINVVPPSLSNLYENFTAVPEQNSIAFGYGHVKNVGVKEAAKIEDIKSKHDVEKFNWIDILCIFNKINSLSMNALIAVGAFNGDYNKNSRDKMLYEYNTFKDLTDKEILFIKENVEKDKGLLYHINLLINKYKLTSSRMAKVLGMKSALENPMYDINDSAAMILQKERFYMGLPLSYLGNVSPGSYSSDTTCLDVVSGNAKGTINLIVNITNVREHKVKSGKTAGQMMAFISGEDSTGCLKSIVAFPKEYAEYRALLVENNNIMIQGSVESRNDEYSLNVRKIVQV
jgi:DNA polymerase-3 subunit alpha